MFKQQITKTVRCSRFHTAGDNEVEMTFVERRSYDVSKIREAGPS
jgi:hypothetical protein